jgi:hypothetical protein
VGGGGEIHAMRATRARIPYSAPISSEDENPPGAGGWSQDAALVRRPGRFWRSWQMPSGGLLWSLVAPYVAPHVPARLVFPRRGASGTACRVWVEDEVTSSLQQRVAGLQGP